MLTHLRLQISDYLLFPYHLLRSPSREVLGGYGFLFPHFPNLVMTTTAQHFRVGEANGLIWLNWDAQDGTQVGFAMEPQVAQKVAKALLQEVGDGSPQTDD